MKNEEQVKLAAKLICDKCHILSDAIDKLEALKIAFVNRNIMILGSGQNALAFILAQFITDKMKIKVKD